MAEEGAVQIFKVPRTEEIILGVVGELQFEVFQHRLQSEYGAAVNLQRLPYQLARWVMNPDPETLSRLRSFVVKDEKDQTVILFENEFSLNYAKDKNPSVTLSTLEECPTV